MERIPEISAARLAAGATERAQELARVREAAEEIGFMTLADSPLAPERVRQVLEAFRAFFHLPEAEKARVDMARTGASRGWGRARSEQVDPAANPDYKEFFDVGFELSPDDPLVAMGLPVYAPNRWPEQPAGFREAVLGYYREACAFALELLGWVAEAIGAPPDHFANRFRRPMALLRANWYPPRPRWAGARDFGIAPHTDYGCLTLLTSDGTPGLEVATRAGRWLPVELAPGRFVINFGEMLEMWTGGRVKATPHRVVGSDRERISLPLFFNPDWDANVAPIGSGREILAGEHLGRRFRETYLHLKQAAGPRGEAGGGA